MDNIVINVCITILMVLGICSVLNTFPVYQIQSRDLASIYTDLHTGGVR